MFVFSVILSFFLIHLAPILASNDTLVFVQTLSRHGARSPISTYPHDNYNESQWFQGFGQLTEIGMQEALDLGGFLRQRYITIHKLLNPKYINKEMYVRSTSIDRTLLTAQLTMQGLYPSPPPLNPVPIHSVAKATDELLNGNCKILMERVTDDYLRKEFRKKSEKYENNLASLLRKLDFEPKSYTEVCMIADSLKCKHFNNFTLPSWASDNHHLFFNFLMEFNDVDFEVEFNRYDNAKLKAGLLLGDIVQNLKNKFNNTNNFTQKAFFYFAHDTTVAPLLAALKVYDNLQPPFISTVIVELYKKHKVNDNDKDNDINNYYVKVMYRNDTNAKPLHLKLPGCQVNCPLQTFINLTKSNVVENWDEVCLPHKPIPWKDLLLYIYLSIGLLIICIILLIICVVLRCRKGVPFHRYIDVPTEIN